MTDELDPKLRELEAKLRQLKPTVAFDDTVAGSRLSSSRLPSIRRHSRRLSAAVCRLLSAVSLAAVTVLAVVCLIPQRQPQPTVLPVLPPKVEPVALANAVPQRQPTFSTMRQQFTQLLDEMHVANLPAEKKPVYPVIEIVVRDEEESGVRSQESGVWRQGLRSKLLLPDFFPAGVARQLLTPDS